MSYHLFPFVGWIIFFSSCSGVVVMRHVDSFVIYMNSMLNYFFCRFESHS